MVCIRNAGGADSCWLNLSVFMLRKEVKMKTKIVQGAYISLEAKDALKREASKRGIFITRLVSEIIESATEKIIRKELRESGKDKTRKNKKPLL